MSENEGSPRADPRSLLGEVEKRLQRELKNGPGRAPSAFEIVLANITTIHQMKRNRFTDAQIVKFLADIGITVTLGTFATYYSKALAQAGKANSRKRGRPARDTYDPPPSRSTVPRQPQATLSSRPANPPKPPTRASNLVLSPSAPRPAPSALSTTKHQDLMRRIDDEGDEVGQAPEVKITPSRKLGRPL